MKSLGLKAAGIALLLASVSGQARASHIHTLEDVCRYFPSLCDCGDGGGGQVPEIDPSSAASALAFVSGSLLVIKSRKK